MRGVIPAERILEAVRQLQRSSRVVGVARLNGHPHPAAVTHVPLRLAILRGLLPPSGVSSPPG